ncbi:hypothetical protein BLA60_41675 [Actinophytocola xinjiangensis]|uniref:DUF3800 domain-containing protein n=1 Tax=Actinophytocola xinjiangensis TaxID=485602 RepID=A0A7Z1ATV0_9PSEU|nr:hypothetical protein [Actinophytocola xinjiangensis]OLF04246.1 hypothetical protein BLA60_41675 [Actinophytocola xinjiangensis]
MTVHAFVDESARPPRYLVTAAIVEPANVRQLRQAMRGLLRPGQRELHFYKEKPVHRRHLADTIARLPVEVTIYIRSWHRDNEPARQVCLARLVGDLVARQAHRLVIDSRNEQDIHDERTLRRFLGPYPSGSKLVYEHLDSTSESLLWIADIAGWCFGAGAEWRKRIDPIVAGVVDLGGP